MKRLSWILLALVLPAFQGLADGADFHVGPGQAYETPGVVPWSSLGPGDCVYIHYRATPYRDLVTITRSGTAGNPIQVIGVNGPNGEQAVMSGEDASISQNVGTVYQNSILSGGVFNIQGSAYGLKPAYIEIRNLTLRDTGLEFFYKQSNAIGALTAGISDTDTTLPVAAVGSWITVPVTIRIGTEQLQVTGKSGLSLTVTRGYAGTTAASHASGDSPYIQYTRGTAGMYIYMGDHITLKDCRIDSNGNGLFINSPQNDPAFMSTNILISGNTFIDNGTVDNDRTHSAYSETGGIVYEYNTFLALKAGSLGISLKDRSAGTVIRYNYIECGGYCLDLVECENNPTICALPSYHETYVYGNVLVNKHSINGQNSARTFIHYGYDGTPSHDRAGTLYCYHNTFAEIATEQFYGYYFKTANVADIVDLRNNVFYQSPASKLATQFHIAGDAPGTYNIGKNWTTPLYSVQRGTLATISGGSNLFADPANSPALLDPATGDYRITAGSTAEGRGGTLADAVTVNSSGADYTPRFQYVSGSAPLSRTTLTDDGAYAVIPVPLVITTGALPGGTSGIVYSVALERSGGTPAYTWDIIAGAICSGLSLSSSGVITGIPAVVGACWFTVRVTDAANDTATRELSIDVTPPDLAIGTIALPAGFTGVAYARALVAKGGNADYTWTMAGGNLPPGLSLQPNGIISGIPSTAGQFAVTVQCASAGQVALGDYVLTVSAAPLGTGLTGVGVVGASIR